jgi:signal transduction histidine kinase
VPRSSARYSSTELALLEVAPRHARLAVEQRILGLNGLLWVLVSATQLGWLSTVLTADQLGLVPWALLLAPSAAGLYVTSLVLWSRLPRARWMRTTALRSPSSLPMLVAGLPLLPLMLQLRVRDDGAKRRVWSDSEIEWGFRELIGFPRRAALTFMLAATLMALMNAGVLALEAALDAPDAFVYCIGAALIAAPGAVLVYSRSQAMIRPELLSAPRGDDEQTEVEGSLSVRLLVPSMAVLLAASVLPGAVGLMAARSNARAHAIDAADRRAGALLEAATASAERLAAAVAGIPGSAAWLQDRKLGADRALRPALAGPIDENGDGTDDALVRISGSTTVMVPLERRPVDPLRWMLPGLLIVMALAPAIRRVATGARRDVRRAREQVGHVARGETPPALRADSFHTRDLRQLVLAVDRLVSRIAEANVAKYVVIEKAQEADRLKSQFLANMSHDLRSPLNSVIGFSDLLLKGIDGELTAEQREIVEIIAERGGYLLRQIDDILDAAKLDAARMEIQPEAMPVANLVNEAIAQARPRIATTTEVTTAIAPGTPEVMADVHRGVQGVAKVIEFASDGIEHDRVMVSARDERRPDGRAIVIDVLTPRRFEGAAEIELARRGFVRMPGREGLGLGVPIAGSIFELHGGSLDIQEASGHTRFSIRLAVATDDA